jgi:hypothetical protein
MPGHRRMPRLLATIVTGAVIATTATLILASAGHATGGDYQSVTKGIGAFTPDGGAEVSFPNPCSAQACPATSTVRIDGYATFFGHSGSDEIDCMWANGREFKVTIPQTSDDTQIVVPLHDVATLARNAGDVLDCGEGETGAWGFTGGLATASVVQGNSLVDTNDNWSARQF